MRKVKKYTCPICDRDYATLGGWGSHLEKEHPGTIPDEYSYARYFYYILTGKSTGSCIVCKKDTEWNESTQKYARFCNNPKCKEEYREVFKKRMIDKYGKVHMLDNPDMQRKMLKGRKISGVYEFNDKGKVEYVGSYEKDFLEMLDKFLQFKSSDIMGPSPHTYEYIYNNPKDPECKNGKVKKFYIPDFYIPSLNLEIEIKDSTNKHHKIQDIDRVKESQKDATMKKNPSINYIKLVEKDYAPFFEYLLELKELVDLPKESTNNYNKAIEAFINGDCEYALEVKLTTAERNALPDEMFGLPKERKYPLNDIDHVREAIRFFNYCSKDKKEELAKNILEAAKKFNLEIGKDIEVGKNNSFKNYININNASIESLVSDEDDIIDNILNNGFKECFKGLSKKEDDNDSISFLEELIRID